MRWSGRSTAALLLWLIAASAHPACAVDSFLDGNPKAPEAIPYRRRVEPTPAAAATPPSAPTPAASAR